MGRPGNCQSVTYRVGPDSREGPNEGHRHEAAGSFTQGAPCWRDRQGLVLSLEHHDGSILRNPLSPELKGQRFSLATFFLVAWTATIASKAKEM